MLNTFFFGYLSLKWRRLVRTLLLTTYIFFISYTVYWEAYIFEYLLFCIGTPIILVLMSWVIKPFVVKEDS
jgi:hypothetical protein